MTETRTNSEWICALAGEGRPQAEALEALRDLLLRASLYTLVSHVEDMRELEDRERLALAEDCAQEAILAVLARLEDFRGESKFTTWAYKFGVNIALTRTRQERWKRVSLDALPGDEQSMDWLHWKEDIRGPDSEVSTLRAEIAWVIQEAIRDELTERQRQVLKWIAFDGVPMDVVVQQLDTNRNAIYKLLHDARVKVKRSLAANGYEVQEVYNLFRQSKT